MPIIVESTGKSIKLEKPLLFAIDPDSSFLYFTKTVSKKLEYMGTLKTQQLFYYCKGNQLSNMHNTMGDIYDKFK